MSPLARVASALARLRREHPLLSLALVCAVARSVMSIAPQYRMERAREIVQGPDDSGGAAGGAAAGSGGATVDGGGSGPGGARSGPGGSSGGAGFACAPGRNGGATDVGVTGTTISLAATVVKSGIGSSFLGEVPIALEAVVNRVNRDGGVCGRLLKLRTVDDGWDRALGQRFIRQFIDEKVFALAVSPSSEGLDNAIRSGYIDKAGIPVVGADGMLISQYTAPWVWPVAASTISTMHVMAQDAAARGAKTFGLVWDRTYHFGIEGEAAFRGAIRRLFPGRPLGEVLRANEGIEAGHSSYKEEVDRFNNGCDPCDFVAMLLEPPSALQWMKDEGALGSMAVGGTGGPQPLFVDSFARECGSRCNGMWVWSGYYPPIPPFDSRPGVRRYLGDMRTQSSTVDVANPFVEGGYLGMRLLVQALERVGPDLTRRSLREVLDSTTLDTGLTEPLAWRPGAHFANVALQAFEVVVNAGSFSGWRYAQTGWVRDRWVGEDAG